jgi:hypothetical protein
VADIFVSYTSNDRDWAFWIGQELEKLGHVTHIHEWEIAAGGNIVAWMEERHDKADHVLCVVSKVYLTKDYSSWERQAAQWAAASSRKYFLLPVFVEKCDAPTLLKPFKRCDLFGLREDEARARLGLYLAPAAKPSGPQRFPGAPKPAEPPLARPESTPFPGGPATLDSGSSEVPTIDAALKAEPPPADVSTKIAIGEPPVPSSLPPDPKMIGRADRLGQLVKAILEEDRPVIVPGALGMGKTTMALAAAMIPASSRVSARTGACLSIWSLCRTPRACCAASPPISGSPHRARLPKLRRKSPPQLRARRRSQSSTIWKRHWPRTAPRPRRCSAG